jgi:hypothetical protein
MRLMDGADQVFSFPFELLLGAEALVGIKNEPTLVSGKYRWNVFRDKQQIQTALEEEQVGDNTLRPSESEMSEWLAARKFVGLSQYRDRAKDFVDSLAFQPQDHRNLLQMEAVHAYIKSMKAIFTGCNAAINLIHSPCAALDWDCPVFWGLFSKVILVVIDPIWGFGNMHSRNQIPARRYLECWLRINQASLKLKQKYTEQVLILSSTVNAIKQAENVARAHYFLGIEKIKNATNKPTLLGEAMGEIGFPFGGIASWNLQSYQSCIADANILLANENNNTSELLDQCQSLFKLLEP